MRHHVSERSAQNCYENKDALIEDLCKLVYRVGTYVYEGDKHYDCFCNKPGCVGHMAYVDKDIVNFIINATIDAMTGWDTAYDRNKESVDKLRERLKGDDILVLRIYAGE